MGMVELIQQKAFLGKEFLTWLWFRSERDGRVDLPKAKPIEVEIMGPILLDAPYGDARASTLRGDSPATSPEAHTALLEGKKLKRARLRLATQDAEWALTLDGETFHLSGAALPAGGRLPLEDLLALRVASARELEETMTVLFERFLEIRLDKKHWAGELEAIHEWVKAK
jgi:hypothetical protein